MQTFYRRRKVYGGVRVTQARRLTPEEAHADVYGTSRCYICIVRCALDPHSRGMRAVLAHRMADAAAEALPAAGARAVPEPDLVVIINDRIHEVEAAGFPGHSSRHKRRLRLDWGIDREAHARAGLKPMIVNEELLSGSDIDRLR